jgi:pimeloyl-ACP methyl ester carboxylesterase
MQTKFFTAPKGHRLAYTEFGDPKSLRTALCVHGLSRNGRDFDFLAQSLAKSGFRVLCPDIVGRGESDWPDANDIYNYATYIADIMALLAHTNTKNVDWIGTSMGGLIAMVLHAHFPHVIKNLVMNDVGPIVPGKSLERIINYVIDWPIFHKIEPAEKFLRKKLSTFGIHQEEHWQHIFKHGIKAWDEKRLVLNYDPRIVSRPEPGQPIEDIDLWHLWDGIKMPTLILRGALSDVLFADTAKQMQSLHGNAALLTFENIGHAPALMDEEQIALVQDWLMAR